MARIYNFSAGPSMLPTEVLEKAQKERQAAEREPFMNFDSETDLEDDNDAYSE